MGTYSIYLVMSNPVWLIRYKIYRIIIRYKLTVQLIFRAKIEADYAKKLKTWNEKMIKALEASTMYGSHQKGLITITAQSEKIANHHQQIHDKIHSDCSTRVRPFLVGSRRWNWTFQEKAFLKSATMKKLSKL